MLPPAPRSAADHGLTAADLAPLLIVLIIAVPFLVTSLGYRFTSTPADETVMAWLGKRIVDGAVPYRDFFSFLPPGSHLTAALPAWVAGPGLTPLRFLTLALLLLATACLYLIARTRGTRRPWSSLVALALPLVIFPFWPVSTHQWLSGSFAMIGLAIMYTSRERFSVAVPGAALVAWSAMIDQLVGGVATLLLVLLLASGAWARRTRIAAGAGYAIVAAAVATWLILNGALVQAFRHIVLWPLLYYKQPGGFNDAEAAGALAVAGTKLSALPWGDEFAAASLMVLLLAVATALVIEGIWRHATAPEQRAAWWFDVSLAAFGLLAFSVGRTDLPHLVYWSPLALVVAARHVQAARASLALAVRCALITALSVSIVRFGFLWRSEPPSLARIAEVDRQMNAHVRATLSSAFPGVIERNEPVAVLSWTASAVYLYWSPVPPPVDWVVPPSGRFGSDDEYEMLARFIDENEVPWLLVQDGTIEEFREAETPLRPTMHDYEAIGATPLGVALRRR